MQWQSGESSLEIVDTWTAEGVQWYRVIVNGSEPSGNPFGFVNVPTLTPDPNGHIVIDDVAYTDDPEIVLRVIVEQALGL